MTVELWLAQILEVLKTHDDQVMSGELSREEAIRHESELMFLARLDLRDEQCAVLEKGIKQGYNRIAQTRARTSNSHPTATEE